MHKKTYKLIGFSILSVLAGFGFLLLILNGVFGIDPIETKKFKYGYCISYAVMVNRKLLVGLQN